MKQNILSYINKLQSYKTAIKNLHWSSGNMSEHKLMDDIHDTVSGLQDKVAEIAQGVYGQIKINELRPKRYNITSSTKMLQDLEKDTKAFYSSTTRNKEMIGIRSELETFIGDLDQFKYLLKFCLKEDLKRRVSTQIAESITRPAKANKMRLSESALRHVVRQAILNTIK